MEITIKPATNGYVVQTSNGDIYVCTSVNALGDTVMRICREKKETKNVSKGVPLKTKTVENSLES